MGGRAGRGRRTSLIKLKVPGYGAIKWKGARGELAARYRDIAAPCNAVISPERERERERSRRFDVSSISWNRYDGPRDIIRRLPASPSERFDRGPKCPDILLYNFAKLYAFPENAEFQLGILLRQSPLRGEMKRTVFLIYEESDFPDVAGIAEDLQVSRQLSPVFSNVQRMLHEIRITFPRAGP